MIHFNELFRALKIMQNQMTANIFAKIFESTQNNDVDSVSNLVNSLQIPQNYPLKHFSCSKKLTKDLANSLVLACSKGSLHIAKFLLSSEKFHQFINKNSNCYQFAFSAACLNEHQECAQLILHHLFYISNFKKKLILDRLCAQGNLELLDYLLTHPQFKKICKESVFSGLFHTACTHNHAAIVDYLIKNKDKIITRNFYSHFKISNDDDSFEINFIRACEFGSYEVVWYFIFSLNIHYSDNIKDCLIGENNFSNKIKKLFEQRNLEHTLRDQFLSLSHADSKIGKI